MRILRIFAAIAIAACAAWSLYTFCWLPYRCNKLKKEIAHVTNVASANPDAPRARILARRTVERLETCLAPGCRDVSLDLLLAANYETVGRRDDALATYEHALTLDRRPEIYLDLAETENADGRREAALEHVMRSVLFNPMIIREINDGLLRDTAVKRLIELRPQHAQTYREIDSMVAPSP